MAGFFFQVPFNHLFFTAIHLKNFFIFLSYYFFFTLWPNFNNLNAQNILYFQCLYPVML